MQGINHNAGFGLALAVDDQEVESLTSNLGVQLSDSASTGIGILTPYLRLDWEHEFSNDERLIEARFANVGSRYAALNTILIPTDEPDRDYANLSLGMTTVFPGGTQAFIEYATILGHEELTLHTIVAGLRFEF